MLLININSKLKSKTNRRYCWLENDKNILEFSLNCTKLAMLLIKAYVGKSKMGIGDIIDFS